MPAWPKTAGVLDLSFRGRICLTGQDRARFLHGQVTNDVKSLQFGQGCYAALTTAKGKMESDLNLYCLKDELLLEFEPGLTKRFLNGWKDISLPTTFRLSMCPARTVC